MSVELQRPKNNNPWRNLRKNEKDILVHLLKSHENFFQYELEMNSRKVRDMLDGGMGSIEFFSFKKEKWEEFWLKHNM